MDIGEIVANGQLFVALLISVAAGIVSFAAPCVLPLVPGYLGYVSGIAGRSSTAGANPKSAQRGERRRMVWGALLFVAGFTIVIVSFASLFGTVGAWLWEWEPVITRVMGAVVVIMGLVFMGAFGFMQRTRSLNLRPRVGLAGAPLLGFVFAVGWAPCMGPALTVIFSLGMQTGGAGRSAALGLAYCIGLGLPFVLAAFGFGWMTQTMRFFKQHMRAVNLVGGGLLILIGLMMVSGLWSTLMAELQVVIGGYVTPL